MKSASFRLVLLVGVAFLFSSGNFAKVEELDPDQAYCFEFTWLGPKWDNTSRLNTTCKDFSARPCKMPLVITHDASPPNTTYMWQNFDQSEISCKLTKGEACTKWVNYYGNEIENITYMCSKFTVEGVSKTNWAGCELQVINSTATEVCACRSATGLDQPPCNGGPSPSAPPHLVFLLAVILLSFLALLTRD